MTIKRVILGVLTVFAIVLIGQDLIASFSQPQFQSRLELYQTNLVLQATELQGDDPNLSSARKALLGNDPFKLASTQYQELRQSAQKNLDRAQTLLTASSEQSPKLKTTVPELERLIRELDLRLGILQVHEGQLAEAQKTWAMVAQKTSAEEGLKPLSETARVLSGLWNTPPLLLPDAESQVKKYLDGWFRNRSLTRLYQLQQRQDALTSLQVQEQLAAEQSFVNLFIVGGVPAIGCLIGVAILLFLGGQWLVRRKQALLDPDRIVPWSTPWDAEIIWQVLIFGFFLVGQLLIPLAIGLLQVALRLDPTTLDERTKAFYILTNYLLLAAGGLIVLFLSVKPFRPLPEGWFQFNLFNKSWLFWGIGGYFAALPLVILISLINQQIWQGQGGSNPILPIALEGEDSVALTIFFCTAAIAAPLFEEILFRGFLLPSLTRYFPVWGAIALSSLIFAIAHLSLSEVLPLTVLGIVLGFVYARSRNLLSSILLHSLWNSGTLLSLYILGSTN